MALVTITEASKLTGKARKTLYSHLKQGKLSSCLQRDGTKQIDTSELIRVYGEIKHKVTEVTPPDVPEVTPSNVTKSTTVELIRAIEIMREQQELDRKENVLLRKQLMELTEKVGSLTNILEHKPEPEPEPEPEPVIQEDTVVIDDEQDIPAFLRKPRSTKKAPVIELSTRNCTNDEMPGPDELNDKTESKYLKIPVFGED